MLSAQAKNIKGMGNNLTQVGLQQATGNIGGNLLVFNGDNTVSWTAQS